MATVDTSTDSATSSSPNSKKASSLTARIAIVVAALALIAVGVIAVVTPESRTVSTVGQPSWPCTLAAARIATLATKPPRHITASTGTCILALGQAATTIPGLAPSIITYTSHSVAGLADAGRTQITHWDGTRGVMSLHGMPVLYFDLAKTTGLTSSGVVIAPRTHLSIINSNILPSIKLGNVKVVGVQWSKDARGNLTWRVALKQQQRRETYQLAFDKTGRLFASGVCETTCTPTSIGSFEIIRPFAGAVTFTPAPAN